MIPKDKSKELVNKFYYTLPNNGHVNQGINSCASRYDEAKKCAIIAVNEILDVDCHDMSEELFDKHIEYYSKVLTEIEILQ
jgi:hypothetical protein